MTTLGTSIFLALLTGGRCSGVALYYENWNWDFKMVVVVGYWLLAQVWLLWINTFCIDAPSKAGFDLKLDKLLLKVSSKSFKNSFICSRCVAMQRERFAKLTTMQFVVFDSFNTLSTFHMHLFWTYILGCSTTFLPNFQLALKDLPS